MDDWAGRKPGPVRGVAATERSGEELRRGSLIRIEMNEKVNDWAPEGAGKGW